MFVANVMKMIGLVVEVFVLKMTVLAFVVNVVK